MYDLLERKKPHSRRRLWGLSFLSSRGWTRTSDTLINSQVL